MRERILTGWSIQRAAYLVIGLFVMIMFAIDKQWAGILLGGYFAAMGMFGFGCAAGNCRNE